MTIALIVAGGIAFLAFDAFVIWKAFGSGNGADSHGRVSAPERRLSSFRPGK